MIGSDEDTLAKAVMNRLSTSAIPDSVPVGKGLIVQASLSADSTVHYSGSDTLDVLGAQGDTAKVPLFRKTGALVLSGFF